MDRKIVCIICPRGCEITVSDKGNGEYDVSGNKCRRGSAYALSEVTAPVRVLTSTMRFAVGKVLPVKTDRPIPKSELFACMEVINSTLIEKQPVKAGDVLIENIRGLGANVIATADSH